MDRRWGDAGGACVQYKQLFDILASRRRRKAIVGSGSYTFFHQKKVRG